MTSAASHWILLGGAIVVGLIAALVGGYFLAMIPVASIDRFSLAAMGMPTVWVLVSLHVLLSTRPLRWSVGYAALSVVLLSASLVHRVFA